MIAAQLCRVYDDLVQAYVAIIDGNVEYALVSLRDASCLSRSQLAHGWPALDRAVGALEHGQNRDALQYVDDARRHLAKMIFKMGGER